MTRPWRSEVRDARISSMISATVVGGALDRAGQRIAAERAEAHAARLGLLAGLERHAVVVDHQQRPVAAHHGPLGGEVERHDRDMLALDVVPDVELGPVRERKDAHRLAAGFAHCRGATARAAGSSDPSGAAPSGTSTRAPWPATSPRRAGRRRNRVEAGCVERLLQPLGLHHVGVDRSQSRTGSARRQALRVDVHDQLEAGPAAIGRGSVHLLELPRRVDVQQRERRLARKERLLARCSTPRNPCRSSRASRDAPPRQRPRA